LTPTQIPDTIKPQVSWVQPGVDGSYVEIPLRLVPLAANATDNSGVARVHFYRWDSQRLSFVDLGSAYNLPYQLVLDKNQLIFGWNEIDVEAFDLSGNISDRQHIFLRKTEEMAYMPIILRGN
jgi:hypothetical protein